MIEIDPGTKRMVLRLVLAFQVDDGLLLSEVVKDIARERTEIVSVIVALAHDLAANSVALAGGDRGGAIAVTRQRLAELALQ
jgi:hypothetical protein